MNDSNQMICTTAGEQKKPTWLACSLIPIRHKPQKVATIVLKWVNAKGQNLKNSGPKTSHILFIKTCDWTKPCKNWQPWVSANPEL